MELAGVDAGAKMLLGLELSPAARANPEPARARQHTFMMFAAVALIAMR